MGFVKLYAHEFATVNPDFPSKGIVEFAVRVPGSPRLFGRICCTREEFEIDWIKNYIARCLVFRLETHTGKVYPEINKPIFHPFPRWLLNRYLRANYPGKKY